MLRNLQLKFLSLKLNRNKTVILILQKVLTCYKLLKIIKTWKLMVSLSICPCCQGKLKQLQEKKEMPAPDGSLRSAPVGQWASPGTSLHMAAIINRWRTSHRLTHHQEPTQTMDHGPGIKCKNILLSMPHQGGMVPSPGKLLHLLTWEA